jgi:hypothetical protein
MKLYRDGDDAPTICGTGLEDYVGSAWGLGPAAPYGSAPLVVQRPGATRPAAWDHARVRRLLPVAPS